MNRLVKPGRVTGMVILLVLLLMLYVYKLYDLQIVEGEKYYNQSSEITTEESRVAAARGNILDRYGRVLVSNVECYNLSVDTAKLFDNDDPNAVILELIDMVEGYGDTYTDDLPITTVPPFEYTEDMTQIQRTMLEAYIERHAGDELSKNPTAVELMSYMRTRYDIDNNYSAEEMRKIAGVRYSINVRYAINTADYVFVQDASMELITYIMENKLVGISVERSYVREYHTEYAAHLLGYTGLMTQEEYEKYSLLNYANDATVGKDGVEYEFEEYLHGENGTVLQTKTASGTVLSTYYEEEPQPGDHIYLTIDSTLQEAVERILDNGVNSLIKTRVQEKAEQEAMGTWTYEDGNWEITGAAAVVVNVKTGEPLAMASWPTYDVSRIIEDYDEILAADNNPLFNRCLLGTYAPGSTFKPCTAIACLTEGVINTERKIDCEGVFTRYASDGYAPECWIWSQGYTHPEENVTTAIRDSCNYYFYSIVNDLGVDKLGEYAHSFGLGVSTGIELTETVGNMSNRENHKDFQGTEWRIGDTLQAGIGQSDSIFTPLQLAEYCATVANKGTRHTASILKSVRSYDYSEKLYERENKVMSTVESEDYNWDAVQLGMFYVANDWANSAAVTEAFAGCSVEVCAKTGTAQKGEEKKNDGFFMCFAPYKNPEVAIVIAVERGGSGAETAFMARQILDVYLNIQSYDDSADNESILLK